MEENVVNTNENVVATSYDNAIKTLLANGAKKISGIRIKNINFEDKDTYTRVSLTLNKAVRGFISKDNGETYEEGMTNVIFTSLFAIIGAIKEDEELSWMANSLLTSPKKLNPIFNGAEITIVQQDVASGEEYTNPFSTRTDNIPQVYDHDIIINHIIKFKLNKMGEKAADKLLEMVLSE